MKVVCKEKLDVDTVKEFECDSYTARSLTPTTHEVILLDKNGKAMQLLQVDARPRQGTDPLRFQSIRVLDDSGVVLWSGDIAGSANEVEDVPAKESLSVMAARRVLAERKVRFKKTMGLDDLVGLLMNSGGMPTNEELGIEVDAEEVEKDADA